MKSYKYIISLYGQDAFKKHYESTKSNWRRIDENTHVWNEYFCNLKNIKKEDKAEFHGGNAWISDEVLHSDFPCYADFSADGFIHYYLEKYDIVLSFYPKYEMTQEKLSKILKYIEDNHSRSFSVRIKEIVE